VATLPVYMAKLKDLCMAVGWKMGYDLTREPKSVRVGLFSTQAGLAVLIKTLTDAGVITDAQLQATLDAATGGNYPDEPNLP